ncbi:hypothetical protein D3C81_1628990 [compost metagenome]
MAKGAIDQAAEPFSGDYLVIRPAAQRPDVELFNYEIGRYDLSKVSQAQGSGEERRPCFTAHGFPTHQQRRQERPGLGGDQQFLPNTNEACRCKCAFAQISPSQSEQGVASESKAV